MKFKVYNYPLCDQVDIGKEEFYVDPGQTMACDNGTYDILLIIFYLFISGSKEQTT